MSIYFQLKVRVLPEISDSSFPKDQKRIGSNGNEQLLAGYILDDIVSKKLPNDGLVIMGITQKDLFPKPEWNYVFGLASYEKGTGVTSIYRFHNGNLTDDNFNKSLERSIKISSHEIGHMFGISHCLHANCVMNGTNSLSETDYHFARACSLCQKKLNHSLKLNNKKRLEELRNFFEKTNNISELKRVEKDLIFFE